MKIIRSDLISAFLSRREKILKGIPMGQTIEACPESTRLFRRIADSNPASIIDNFVRTSMCVCVYV